MFKNSFGFLISIYVLLNCSHSLVTDFVGDNACLPFVWGANITTDKISGNEGGGGEKLWSKDGFLMVLEVK